ncbi:PREDICTED: GDSL esterase/lipase 7-like isoform X1 [Lupinus angustifolius]|uniref:GDSL esterase/lipase 7-like isoform X1 n=1 Tax=Lupinus angustifolius TaxID=3871 RepID=UPI00092EFDDB|nr:PREDICTED: GDSL esterase/lipase 7-like isoform X1 [Lupinus angustifolius]XP_019427031.1 PREDICTED: GDSL esterase/lipase 7-like isoform X1 [Lupinus angustifolius]
MKMAKVFLILSLVFLHLMSPICTLPLAPALYVFGDSLFDSGNNNFLPTFVRANFLPYGSDFANGSTGRFTNGRTIADFIAEYLGLPYSPPYLSSKGPSSLTGLNYASGSCGILPDTGSILGECLNFEEQINLFQRTIEKDLPQMLNNSTQLSKHLSESIYLISIGSNDYINNYLETMYYNTSKLYLPKPFAKLLISNLSQQFERLYKLGARKMIFFDIGPLGCIPSISRTHAHEGDCIEEINQIVSYFNERLPFLLKNMTSNLPASTFVLGHANSLGYDAIKNPSTYGLIDASNPCCTTWGNGTSGCIPMSKPCINPNKHFFWDGYHLTEAVYSIIAYGCLYDRSACTPLNIQELVKM